jgi:hypothetical protein
MFDDLFDNKKCLICNNLTSNLYFCNNCEDNISSFSVTHSEIVDNLIDHYENYGYNDTDINKLISRVSLRIKIKKYIEKISLQK